MDAMALQSTMVINAYGSQLSNGILLKAYKQRQDVECGSYYKLHLVSYVLKATCLISQMCFPF